MSDNQVDTVEKSIKDKLGYAHYIIGIAVLMIWFFGKQILEIARDYDAVKKIPTIERSVEKIQDELKLADERSKHNKRELEEMQRELYPRVPAWRTETVKLKGGT